MLPPPGLPSNGKMQAAARVSSAEKDGAAQAVTEDLLRLLDPSVPAPPLLPVGLLPRLKPARHLSCGHQQRFLPAVLAPKAALPPGHQERRDVGASSVQHRSMN